MKHLKDLYTNEDLSGRFGNQFQLVNYAIGVASHFLKSGRETLAKTDVQNPVYNVLEEILNHQEITEADDIDEQKKESAAKDAL